MIFLSNKLSKAFCERVCLLIIEMIVIFIFDYGIPFNFTDLNNYISPMILDLDVDWHRIFYHLSRRKINGIYLIFFIMFLLIKNWI